MLKRLAVRNFRCLQDLEISFEPGITLIAGENDSGKSSILDLIWMASSKRFPDVADLSYGQATMRLELEFDTDVYVLKNLGEGEPFKWFKRIPWAHLARLLENPSSIDELEPEQIRSLLLEYGIATRKTAADSLRQELRGLIEVNRDAIKERRVEEVEVRDLRLPCSVYRLDGRTFEDISSFVKSVYLHDALKQVWSETVRDGDTEVSLETAIRGFIDKIRESKQQEINEAVLPVIREFLPEVHEIKLFVEPEFRDLNAAVGVIFRGASGDEVMVAKKGDGTRRRVTMALLRHKVEQERASHRLFLLDEPDTHLHVKAQRELVAVIEQMAANNQVIICTHSPFLVNSVDSRNIRLLRLVDGHTEVLQLAAVLAGGREHETDQLLKALGIENTDLFFTRKVLIVEGKSETVAIPLLFQRSRSKSPRNELVTMVDAGGVDSAAHVARVLTSVLRHVPIVALVDRDYVYRRKTKELLDRLKQDGHPVEAFPVGYKELEDAFDCDVIYDALRKYCGEDLKPDWQVENIQQLKECLRTNPHYKFSGALEKLSGRSKPEVCEAIARYCPLDRLPKDLVDLFQRLSGQAAVGTEVC